jgi:hypothetical protein
MITNETFRFEIALSNEQETINDLRYCKIIYWFLILLNFSWRSVPYTK